MTGIWQQVGAKYDSVCVVCEQHASDSFGQRCFADTFGNFSLGTETFLPNEKTVSRMPISCDQVSIQRRPFKTANQYQWLFGMVFFMIGSSSGCD